jgi:hypothetical protein
MTPSIEAQLRHDAQFALSDEGNEASRRAKDVGAAGQVGRKGPQDRKTSGSWRIQLTEYDPDGLRES